MTLLSFDERSQISILMFMHFRVRISSLLHSGSRHQAKLSFDSNAEGAGLLGALKYQYYRCIASATIRRFGSLIHQIRFNYRDGGSILHGRTCGDVQELLKLGWGEHVTGVYVKCGADGLEDIMFRTSRRPCHPSGPGWKVGEGAESDPIVNLLTNHGREACLRVFSVVR